MRQSAQVLSRGLWSHEHLLDLSLPPQRSGLPRLRPAGYSPDLQSVAACFSTCRLYLSADERADLPKPDVPAEGHQDQRQWPTADR